VERMDKADEEKLFDRLESFAPRSGVDADVRSQAREIADGYPRLLEWLDRVLAEPSIEPGAILTAMKGKQAEFLENILAAQLLAQQQRGLRLMLERGTLFDLPVPFGVLKSICGEFEAEFARHVVRAQALGLLESGLTDGLVRVPKVLNLTLKQQQQKLLAALAVRELDRLWSEIAPSTTEEQQVEIHRLAILGGDGEIAVKMAQTLSNRWIAVSRYHAARTLCEETLALQTDSTIIHNLSRISDSLGDLNQALTLSQQSLELDRAIGNREGEAASLHQMSIISHSLGDLNQALTLSQQSLEIFRAIGNRKGEAASLHQMSIISYSLGDLNQALTLSQQSLELDRAIGNREGEADSLHQMSMISGRLGDLNQALTLSQQSLELDRAIGNREGEAASLHQMSMISHSLGDLNQALTLSQQSLEIQRAIGNRQGEAGSLRQMSRISDSLGDLNQALTLSQESLEILRAIGNRQGEAASLHQMASIAYQQGDPVRKRELYLQAATIRGSIGDYGGLVITLWNLGINNDEPDALGYLAQSLWLTLRLSTNLEDAISLIQSIFDKIPSGDPLKALLGSTAVHFCATRSHPKLPQLTEQSRNLLENAASQQGIDTPEEREKWFVADRLGDAEYVLAATSELLESMVGDGWLFDRSGL
jgi:tetratricopeptide (TPR) repeat protein